MLYVVCDFYEKLCGGCGDVWWSIKKFFKWKFLMLLFYLLVGSSVLNFKLILGINFMYVYLI